MSYKNLYLLYCDWIRTAPALILSNFLFNVNPLQLDWMTTADLFFVWKVFIAWRIRTRACSRIVTIFCFRNSCTWRKVFQFFWISNAADSRFSKRSWNLFRAEKPLQVRWMLIAAFLIVLNVLTAKCILISAWHLMKRSLETSYFFFWIIAFQFFWMTKAEASLVFNRAWKFFLAKYPLQFFWMDTAAAFALMKSARARRPLTAAWSLTTQCRNLL